MTLDQFIVSGDPRILRSLIDIFEADAEVSVVSVVDDGHNGTQRLVILIEPGRAQALTTVFPSIDVEPDQLIPFL